VTAGPVVTCKPVPSADNFELASTWPRDASFARAQALGLVADASIDAIVRDHLDAAVRGEASGGAAPGRDPSLRSG